MILISIIIKFSSKGPVIHWSDRIGQNNLIFKMPKFRTLKIDTPQVATHLLENPNSYYIPFGSFLRKTSFDELPQLISILKGEMSLVGPRPALYNQDDLIRLRSEIGIDKLKPGITGWAQVNGRDDLSIESKVALEKDYLVKRSFFFDIYILWLTFMRLIYREGVAH